MSAQRALDFSTTGVAPVHAANRDMPAVHPGRSDWVKWLQLQGGLQNPVASAAIRRQAIPQPWRAAKGRQLLAAMTALAASETPAGSPCSSPGLATSTSKNMRMPMA